MNISSKYIFNPHYALRNDKKRILLINTPKFKADNEIAEEDISSFIHPVFAIVFCFFNGENTLYECIAHISKMFNVNRRDTIDFIKPFFENTNRVLLKYDNEIFEFPRMILLDNSHDNYSKRELDLNNYIINEELDFSTERLFTGPSTINFLVNTICATDCIYCYADRRNKSNCQIPIERIFELIREAKEIGVVDFDISGTEIFLYNEWEKLVEELLRNDYYPYLSTKMPIDEKTILRLKEIGINDIQLSIDTINDDESIIINKSKKGYTEKMFSSLELLDKYEITVVINVVITKFNSTQKGIIALLDKLNEFSRIEKVTLNPAERSLACTSEEFDDFKNYGEELNKLEQLIKSREGKYIFEINFAGYSDKSHFEASVNDKKRAHRERASCTANVSQICILNDGQVTICEELYWDNRFIIGNVLSDSILEVWNSEKAKKLAKLSTCDFSNNSICKSCNEFEDCRLGKGVCWSNVIMAYGEENWDFPSPECPYAPEPMYSIHHD